MSTEPHTRAASPAPPGGAQDTALPVSGFFYVGVLYVVWSTSYLAIRVAVTPGEGFAPFVMSGLRVLAAGTLLGLAALATRKRLRVSRRDLGILAASGLLLWIGGNGMVTWAVQYADSGFAALMIGALPIWSTVIESILDRRLPSPRMALALAVGFAGVAVLTLPQLQGASSSAMWALLALIVAPISWACGAVLQNRKPPEAEPIVSAAWQQWIGAAGFLLISLALAEPSPDPTPRAFTAWLYLATVGAFAFFAFVRALSLMPPRIVMTYAYVNPVGAALLGWWILGEELGPAVILGGALVLLGVAGVFHERYGRGRGAAPEPSG